MVNKRGWIRIVEASVAILLILGALLLVNRQQTSIEEEDLSSKARDILDEMFRQEIYRESFLSEPVDFTDADNYVKDIIDENVYGFEFRICEKDDVCSLENYPPNAGDGIYGAERIIAGSIIEDGETPIIIVKLFIWRIS